MHQKKELRKIHFLSSNFIEISNSKQKLWRFQNFENTFFIEKINFSLISAIKNKFWMHQKKELRKIHRSSSNFIKKANLKRKLCSFENFGKKIFFRKNRFFFLPTLSRPYADPLPTLCRPPTTPSLNKCRKKFF